MIMVVIFYALFATAVQAQFEIYGTVDDLINNTPQTYPGFDFDSQKGKASDSKIILKNDATNDRVEIDCSVIWGFAYRGQLFRIVKSGKYYNDSKAPQHMPVKLMLNKGGAFYWLNAPHMISYLRESAEREAAGKTMNYSFQFVFQSFQGFLSSSLNGDLMVVLGGKFAGTPKWVGTGEEEFMKDNPALEWLKSCVMDKDWKYWGQHYTHSMVKECIEEYYPPVKSVIMERPE